MFITENFYSYAHKQFLSNLCVFDSSVESYWLESKGKILKHTWIDNVFGWNITKIIILKSQVHETKLFLHDFYLYLYSDDEYVIITYLFKSISRNLNKRFW